MTHVLIVDDEPSICWGLAKAVQKMGYRAESAASAEAGLRSARARRPDAIVLDVRLPGTDGLSAMAAFREELGTVPIIVMTAYGQLETAVQAVRNGAFDYLTKPFDLDVAQNAIRRALGPGAVSSEEARQTPDAEHGIQIVGTSPAIQEVFKQIALVAPSEACVHIRGESGTGKELVARAIHHYSRRWEGPFVAVNVASLSPSLAESELFGHVRGAFTGADHARKGLLEQADGGTIFVDEVADIPAALQVKLLRALEHGELLPVGAERPIQSDFRIISATHQNLCALVAEGRFRHDLYFRLVTFQIDLPPLRERRQDIRPLAEHFLGGIAAKIKVPRPAWAPETIAELERRPWYGNVRELRNAIEHAMVVARGGAIGPEHLPPPAPLTPASRPTTEEAVAGLIARWAGEQLQEPDPKKELYKRLMNLVEPPLLKAAMDQHRGQCAAAARCLGLHRTTLRKKLDQFGIGDG